MKVFDKIFSLTQYLNDCTLAYDMGNPVISDTEWDKLYFELKKLEEETGLVLGNSPTQSIQYEVVNDLKKVAHGHKMLSLDKTKATDEVARFVGNEPFLAMLKLDGLTCSLTYEDGELVSAETRGNGFVGEDITHNVRVIPSIPKRIPVKGRLVVDGEVISLRKDFEEFANEYKNPRNFAAGSIRLLDARECAMRKLTFVAWEVIEGIPQMPYLDSLLEIIENYGFTVVPHMYVSNRGQSTPEEIQGYVDELKEFADREGYPIDGAVFKFNDVLYSKLLGETAHHFKNAIAYKFEDELYETRLVDIEWTMGRTGSLTPIAVFSPVDIDGSVVMRASLHNISVMHETLGIQPFENQKIEVYKANMIIPQVAPSIGEVPFSDEQKVFMPPEVCPVCGQKTEVRENNGVKVLWCTNPNCEGKFINRLDHFCGKKGLDIKGLSKATLEKLCDWGYVGNLSDLFHLHGVSAGWKLKSGFGEKSVNNILDAVEVSRQNCEPDKFIAALGIPLIGTTASRELIKHFGSWDSFIEAVENNFKFYELPNFGNEMHQAIMSFDFTEAKDIVSNFITFVASQPINHGSLLDGQTFVITGKVSRFKNRDAVKEAIEAAGGRVVGSVSKNTKYLVNNDTASTSAKNKAAQSLGVPIISEEDLISMLGMSN